MSHVPTSMLGDYRDDIGFSLQSYYGLKIRSFDHGSHVLWFSFWSGEF